MYTLNEMEMLTVAGGEPPNNPIFDTPIGAIYGNFRNAGASVGSSVYQTFGVIRLPVVASAAAGATIGTFIYNSLPQEAQNTIGGTISAALDNIHDFFGNHFH